MNSIAKCFKVATKLFLDCYPFLGDHSYIRPLANRHLFNMYNQCLYGEVSFRELMLQFFYPLHILHVALFAALSFLANNVGHDTMKA